MGDDRLTEEVRELMESVLNGTLSAQQEERLQDLLNHQAEARRYYLRYMDLHVGLLLADRKRMDHVFDTSKSALTPELEFDPQARSRTEKLRWWPAATALVACVGIVATVVALNSFSNKSNVAKAIAIQSGESSTASPDAAKQVVLAQHLGALFFRDSTPEVGSSLKLNHEYSLLQGQIEVHFPRGASAIFDGPAVFRVNSAEQIFVSYGNCSVHAPDGAEGFEILTPRTQFIDRGTRFVVKVDESGESEVHVIEGLVDAIESAVAGETHLTEGEARRYSRFEPASASGIRYSSSIYRKGLPDRLVSFDGPVNEHEEIERLEHAQVMRGGKLCTYAFNELIGGDVTSFCELGAPVTTNLILPKGFHGDRRELFVHDDSFLTGVLNPGGSAKPFYGEILTPVETSDPSQWTPGMTVTFRKPVVNSPGPDILFFDIHTPIHPLEGDQFHVRPVELKPKYHAHTVTQYDIGMLAPESPPISSFVLLETRTAVTCLEDLASASMRLSNIALNYRIVGTGIDLSNMGVPEGESVSAIFLQDVLDDEFRIDPVMIVGLPGVLPIAAQ